MQILNAPGRFDTSPRLVRNDARRQKRIPGLSVIFKTEMADEARAAALSKDGDGWTVSHDDGPGRGECAILTKDSARTVVETRWVKITDGGGRGRLARPVYAIVTITKSTRTGRVTLLTGAHLPAHIEGIWARIPLPDRIKVRVLFRRSNVNGGILQWIEAVHRWRGHVMRIAAEHQVDDIIVAPDGNVDAHKRWVRRMIGRAWPGLGLAVTKGDDLNNRAVGWVLTTMDHTGGRVYRQESSDHKAGLYELKHINPPKPTPTPLKPPPPFERVVYNGALMDQKTKAAVQLGEKRLGYPLTILQGCYHPGVSQSAGTHDGGGVIDFAPFDWVRKVRVFREMGWFIWHRLPIPGVWGEHIHGGIRNHGRLSPSAARQQVDFDSIPSRNGLATHAVDTSGIHPQPPKRFSYLATWHEVNQ